MKSTAKAIWAGSITEGAGKITAGSGLFKDAPYSAKGRFDPKMPKSYYPPRNDLTTFGPTDCDQILHGGVCPSTSATHNTGENARPITVTKTASKCHSMLISIIRRMEAGLR